jgi:methionyl-tRNA formyltransferase
MTSISQPIVFFGTEDFSLTTLQALIDAGYPVAAVVTKPDSPQGRGHVLTEPPVKVLAKKHTIPVWQPTKLSEITDSVRALQNPVGVLVSYGKIIPQSIIELFTPGIINVHPSLLPKYRGPSPIESAIIAGDNETGVSIMQLSAAMDAGPVYTQTKQPLRGNETASELYNVLGKQGAELIVELLPSIVDMSLVPTPQDDAAATYCKLIQKSDGLINWGEEATTIEARIRAYELWPKSRATLGTVDTIITKAGIVAQNHGEPGHITINPTSDNPLVIDTSSGAVSIKSLKPVGKKEMPVQAFLSGYASQIV